jgi:dihydrolipoamide dehydrogenase
MPEPRDLVVIGSGPGGYVAAIRAAQLGLKVTVVEKDAFLGGTCLHRGCIPTKALLHTADLLEEARRGADVGVACAEPTLDLARAHQHKQKVVRKNAKGIESLFRKNHVDVVRGRGRLDTPPTRNPHGPGARRVVVDGEGGASAIDARNVLIATGSAVRGLPFLPFDGKRVLSSDHILELGSVPATLAILGAGAVGVEFASMFATFGARVTLIEMLPRVLPLEDEEISAALAKALTKRGIEVLTSTSAAGARVSDTGVALELSSRPLDVERVLVAVGRRPVTEDLGLEAAGIEVERGFVRVDRYMQTAAAGVYAIGDVVPTPQLAHLASAEGILAVEHMAGRDPRPIDYDQVPSCTYCDPEVASIGLTETKARERGYQVATGKFPFTALAKASILGRGEGFVKVVRETTHDQLLGVHAIGARVTEMIAEAGIALRLESTAEDLERAIHPHPTLSEAMMEAARVAAGRGLHI